jgi:hypothetical protein
VSTEPSRSPDSGPHAPSADDLFPSRTDAATTATLGSLPSGARLVLRCRKDWRVAAVAFKDPETARVVLSVGSPSGHTYRLRRPADAPLNLDGPIPVLGEGQWRAGLARYDVRW